MRSGIELHDPEIVSARSGSVDLDDDFGATIIVHIGDRHRARSIVQPRAVEVGLQRVAGDIAQMKPRGQEAGEATEELGAIDAAPSRAGVPSGGGRVERSARSIGGIVIAAGDVVADAAADLVDRRIEKSEWCAERAGHYSIESGKQRTGAAGAQEAITKSIDPEPVLESGAAVRHHAGNVGDKAFGGFVPLGVGDAGDAGARLIRGNREVGAGPAPSGSARSADVSCGADIAPNDFIEGDRRAILYIADDRATDASDPGIAAGVVDVSLSVFKAVVAPTILRNHENTDSDGRKLREERGHLKGVRASAADVADGAGIVADKKTETAGDHGRRPFGFRQENAIQTNQQPLLGYRGR